MPISYFSASDSPFQWIDITSPSEAELLEIGEKYNIHRYSIRDCMEPDHLPKHEALEEHQFIIARLIIESTYEKSHSIRDLTSKLAIFFSDNLLITVHRLPLPFIELIKTKYFDSRKSITSNDLVVRLLWNVLETYEKPALDLMGIIDTFEEKIFLKNISPVLMKQLYYIRRKTHICMKLLTMTNPIIMSLHGKDKIALNDLKDMYTKLQSYYNQNLEDVNSLLNFYISLSSQKTNEVMRILTVFSAFFCL